MKPVIVCLHCDKAIYTWKLASDHTS